MINAKYLIRAVLLLFLSLGLILVLLKKTDSNTSQPLAHSPLKLSESSYSWGEIDYDAGEKIAEFSIKNNGSETVDISDLRTSCMCTQAQIIIGTEQSPKVRMMDNTGWKSVLNPNELATIRVIFNPAYHGLQGLGDIKRIITLKTNAEGFEQLEFSVDGTVVKK